MLIDSHVIEENERIQESIIESIVGDVSIGQSWTHATIRGPGITITLESKALVRRKLGNGACSVSVVNGEVCGSISCQSPTPKNTYRVRGLEDPILTHSSSQFNFSNSAIPDIVHSICTEFENGQLNIDINFITKAVIFDISYEIESDGPTYIGGLVIKIQPDRHNLPKSHPVLDALRSACHQLEKIPRPSAEQVGTACVAVAVAGLGLLAIAVLPEVAPLVMEGAAWVVSVA